MKASGQSDLFGTDDIEREAAAARARGWMRETIERLRQTTTPQWRDQMAVILDDGAFKRAMWSVPKEEGGALWAEYDAEMERLYAIWAADPARGELRIPGPDG